MTPTIAENKGAAGKLQRAELWKNGNDAKTEGAGTLNSENAQKSLIGDFLAQDIPEVVAEQENAPERPQTALKRKPFEHFASRGIPGHGSRMRSSEKPLEAKPLEAGRFNRGAGRFQAKPSARSSENAPQSLIGRFLLRDIPNIVFEGKNAIAGL